MTVYTVLNAAAHELLFTAYLRELAMILDLHQSAVDRIERDCTADRPVELHFNGKPSCFGFNVNVNVKSVLVFAEGGR